jgi:hypothetical protein
MFGPKSIDQRSVETVEMARIGSTQTIDTTDSSLSIIHRKCRLLVRDVFLQLIVFIETDNDGIADIAHEVLHKIYSYAILNYHHIHFVR